MSFGERLQQLRKENGMSQEELGNLLFVSRQTVSLWENNQTVPTVDNLVRLKEIFGVSLDSILTGEESEQPLQNEVSSAECSEIPVEKVSCSFEKNDLKYFYKIVTMPIFKRFAVATCILLFLSFSVVGITAEDLASQYSFFIVFVVFCVSLIAYLKNLFLAKGNAEAVCNRKYTYEMFQDHFWVRVFNSGDEIKSNKIYFNDLTCAWETPFCYFLQHKDKTTFIIKKSSLEENSYIGNLCCNMKSEKTDLSNTKIVFLKKLGEILFVGSFISLLTASTLSFKVFSQDAESLRDHIELLRWFHYLLPIPIVSVVTGILLNKNKVRNKKNIVCGIIIGLLMLIYGFFPSIYADDANSRLGSIEAQLGFEFPPSVEMDYNVEYGVSGEYQIITTLSFEESVAKDFEAFMQDDERWVKGKNDAFKEEIPFETADIPTDYFLIYNTETNEFGKFPEGDSECEYIYVAYDAEMNVAYICQYHCGID